MFIKKLGIPSSVLKEKWNLAKNIIKSLRTRSSYVEKTGLDVIMDYLEHSFEPKDFDLKREDLEKDRERLLEFFEEMSKKEVGK